MRKKGVFFTIFLYLVVVLVISSCASHSRFIPLFNGENLDNWEVKHAPGDIWKVEDGVMYCNGKGGGWIQTKNKYRDFVFSCEWKIPENGNSGIFMKIKDDSRDPCWDGIEIQICDDFSPGNMTRDPVRLSGGSRGIEAKVQGKKHME